MLGGWGEGPEEGASEIWHLHHCLSQRIDILLLGRFVGPSLL